METLKAASRIISVLFVICYANQLVYIFVSLLSGRKERKAEKAISLRRNRYAVLICARNEEEVIGDLVRSVRRQTYPGQLVDTYVMADNCTDGTVRAAANAGAYVFERNDRSRVGKGYALDALLRSIRETEPEGYDGYFVFDADNILAPDYIEQMDRTFSKGYDIVTGYRNSKNYGSNWISAGYALWFIRESMYLSYPRHLVGSSCTVSGTGFMFSREVAEEMDGWPYHTLTEDLEFSCDQITRGRKIAFCRDAEFFDEQPVELKQSWDQRMRWCRGYLQVFGKYGMDLMRGAADGSYACLDCILGVLPAFALSVLSFCIDLALIICAAAMGEGLAGVLLPMVSALICSYTLMLILGAVTLVTEWKNIKADTQRKIVYLFSFPVFMMTYAPIAIASLFVKAEWKPIRHTFSAERLGQVGVADRGAV